MSQTSIGAPPARALPMSPRDWGMLFVLCGAIFLEGVDVAMINVALPSIRAELGLSTGALQWIVSAYVLGYGGFMLLGGRAADLLGRRRMFVFWLAVFAAFSALGSFADQGWTLIAARFVTGVAAAFMTPAGLSIITSGFPEGPQRNRALFVYAGTAAAGFSLGLVGGGLLTTIDWRWVFFGPALFALLLLVLALVLLPKTPRPPKSGQRMDFAGAAAITATLVLAVVSVERSAHSPLPVTLALLAGALACLAAFVLVEKRSPAPLVRLGIFRSAALIRSNLTGLLFAAAFFSFQFIIVLYLRELRGWSILATSLAMLAVAADAVLAPTLTPSLVRRFGNTRVIFGGLLLAALAYLLLLPIGLDWTYLAMFPTMILLGVAFALVYGPLTAVATDGVAESEHGLAGGLLYTSFQFGAALGLSGATLVLSGWTGLDGVRAALVLPLAAVVLAAIVTATGLRAARTPASR